MPRQLRNSEAKKTVNINNKKSLQISETIFKKWTKRIKFKQCKKWDKTAK